MKLRVLLFMMFINYFSFGNSISEGLKLYDNGDYVRAINSFKEIPEENYNADLYYNLGNSYFKNNQLGHAIASYKKALKLNPKHKKSLSNLKTIEYRKLDKIRPLKPFVLVSIWEELRNWFSSNVWFIVSMFLFTVFSLFIGLALNKKRIKLNSSLSVCFLLLGVLAMSLSVQRKKYETTISHGVIIVEEAGLFISPNTKSKTVNYIHEGTSFELLNDGRDGFAKVKIANGDIGWVEENKFEGI